MNKKYNFGIIGCGAIAPCHASSIKQIPEANLYAVCDIVAEKANNFAKQYSVEKIYYDYKDMLKDPQVDIVNVCVPSGLHGEISIAAAEAGKHIVCEKPMEITSKKMEDMIKAVRENKVKMQVIYQRRTMSLAIAAKKAVQEGKLGKIVLASAYLKYYRPQEYYDSGEWRGTWELDGGGALMNQGVHGIDLLTWMVGERVNKVFARAGTLARNIEVEDTGVALLEFSGGGYGVIEGATTVYPGLDTKFEIHGEKGTIIFSDSGLEKWEFIDKKIPKPESSEKLGGANNPSEIKCVGHYILLKDLIEAIRTNREPMIPPEEGKKAVDLILTIYKAAKANKDLLTF
jgi:predicted dehydrogenase